MKELQGHYKLAQEQQQLAEAEHQQAAARVTELQNSLAQEELWHAEEQRRAKDARNRISELSKEVEELLRQEAEMNAARQAQRTVAATATAEYNKAVRDNARASIPGLERAMHRARKAGSRIAGVEEELKEVEGTSCKREPRQP